MSPLKYDADGRIVSDSEGKIVSWANGLPFTGEGALAISTAPVVAVQGGVPTDESGKVVVSA